MKNNHNLLNYKCLSCNGKFIVEVDCMPKTSEMVMVNTLGQKLSFNSIFCFCPYCKSEDVVCNPIE